MQELIHLKERSTNINNHSTLLEKLLRELTAVIRGAENPEAARIFFSTLLTPRERSRLALRWRLVCMLRQGFTQREIGRLLGVSLCKITRGAKVLKDDKSVTKKILGGVQKKKPTVH